MASMRWMEPGHPLPRDPDEKPEGGSDAGLIRSPPPPLEAEAGRSDEGNERRR